MTPLLPIAAALLQLPVTPPGFPVARLEITPTAAAVEVGQPVRFTATAFSRHGDPRADLVSFSSGNPRVASVTVDGRLHAVAPGQAAVTARAGPAVQILQLEVVPNTVVGLALEPATASVRTGDVVRFTVSAKQAGGRPMRDVPVEWALSAATGIAHIDPEGVFVAETPGLYTVTAALGGRTAEALVRVEQRRGAGGVGGRGHPRA